MSAQEERIQPSLIDQEFRQIGCLGHGGFGSVFLAQKKSGRHVALKFIRFNEFDIEGDEGHGVFMREMAAIANLKCESSLGETNPLTSIVHYEDWIVGPNFACIVMQYADGGTLAQEILARQDALDQGRGGQPYTERRIAWYALQLSEALAHAHSRGVAHYDVKSSNVLIDRSSGGKLLLADFGSAVMPNAESDTFTEIYAAPELMRANKTGDFTGLEPFKIDAFSLGCILFEMVCCKKLLDLTQDKTLAECIEENRSAEFVFSLPCLRLPFHADSPMPEQQPTIGYTVTLKNIIKSLLELQPTNRCTPSELQVPLREDSRSPIIQDYVPAAQTLVPGTPVTMDNIQLGMFVQRAIGCHWADGDADGGENSVGVVVGLDPDAGYTTVAFPSRTQPPPKPFNSLLCRIGAFNKYELQVGPTPMKDFLHGSDEVKLGGGIYSSDASKYELGQLLNPNCMVVGRQGNTIFIAPLEKFAIPALPLQLPSEPVAIPQHLPRAPLSIPDSWDAQEGQIAPVRDNVEQQRVLDAFFSEDGGMDSRAYEVVSIKRIQSKELWLAFAEVCEQVAAEHWGIVNEKRLFWGTKESSVETLLCTPSDFFRPYVVRSDGSAMFGFSRHAKFGDAHCHRRLDDNLVKEVVLCRVALGRTEEENRSPSMAPLKFHSQHTNWSAPLFLVQNPLQAYPEYVISYRTSRRRRLVMAKRPTRGENRGGPGRAQQHGPGSHNSASMVAPPVAASRVALNIPRTPGVVAAETRATTSKPSTPGSAATKLCVVCLERGVCMILIPCGHACLCELCSTNQALSKLNRKCPECRTPFAHAARFYGRLVED